MVAHGTGDRCLGAEVGTTSTPRRGGRGAAGIVLAVAPGSAVTACRGALWHSRSPSARDASAPPGRVQGIAGAPAPPRLRSPAATARPDGTGRSDAAPATPGAVGAHAGDPPVRRAPVPPGTLVPGASDPRHLGADIASSGGAADHTPSRPAPTRRPRAGPPEQHRGRAGNDGATTEPRGPTGGGSAGSPVAAARPPCGHLGPGSRAGTPAPRRTTPHHRTARGTHTTTTEGGR